MFAVFAAIGHIAKIKVTSFIAYPRKGVDHPTFF
jgi:hypothetical protein